MKAHARTLDPTTSHEAARSVKNLTETQQLILKLFKLPNAGFTDEELIIAYSNAYGRHFPATESSIRSRRSELVKRGELSAMPGAGGKPLRRLTKAGNGSTVWTLNGRML